MAEKRRAIKLDKPREVRRALARIATLILNGEITPAQGNALIYACNTTLSAIRTDELEARLDALEQATK
jgi:hypothetical protein